MKKINLIIICLVCGASSALAKPTDWVYFGSDPFLYDDSTNTWFYVTVLDNRQWAFNFNTDSWELWREGSNTNDIALDPTEVSGVTVVSTEDGSGSVLTLTFQSNSFTYQSSTFGEITLFGEFLYEKTSPTTGTITLILDPVLLTTGEIYTVTQVVKASFETKSIGTWEGYIWERIDTVSEDVRKSTGVFEITDQ